MRRGVEEVGRPGEGRQERLWWEGKEGEGLAEVSGQIEQQAELGPFWEGGRPPLEVQ